MENHEINILIVDDEEKIAKKLYKIATNEGFTVDNCTSSIDAINLLKQKEYHIIFTDLNMPNKTGFDLMEFIQNNNLDIIIVVITGYASVETAIKSIKFGVFDFIQKPFDIETFKLVLHRAALTAKLKEENKRNIEELKKLNNLKNEFLSIVSHDLRSPLSSIGAYAKYLQKKEDFPQKYIKHIKIMGEIADNLYSLVNELLDISKIEMGILKPNYEPVDINKLIEHSINYFTNLANEKNNKIIYNKKPDNPYIQIDKIKIMQVINNLLSNAIKFSENGTIEINAESNSKGLKISITDTGVGIDKKLQKTLFNQFEITHKDGTRGESGTGLGLIICKRFIELHNGKITFTSKLNKGTTFHIFLPYNSRQNS